MDNMTLNLESSFERCCRLCAQHQDVTLKIFSQEAEAMLLQRKLNKYLLIEVDEDDKLPKNICITCCTKLQSVCEFIDTAHKAQEVLYERISELDQILLEQNSYNIKKESVSDDDAKITKMEVSVDPMVVLQNSGQLLSPVAEGKLQSNINRQSSINGVTFLGGADGENVTLQLISKGNMTNPHENIPEIVDGAKSVEKKDSRNGSNAESKNNCVKPFPCVICKRGFFTELALKNHRWIHTNDEGFNKSYKCHSCPEHFEFKADLIAHMKLHKVLSTCNICGRCFRSEYALKVHMKIHQTPGKSYSCKDCGRSYNTKSNLKTHSVTHSNERPYQCHFCKKSFKRNQDLKFHVNQHTGNKPFKCPFCDKCFASSGNCYSHRSRMHPGRRIESKLRRRTVPVRDLLSQPRPDAVVKTNCAAVKGVYKYQCQTCNHTFMKRDNFMYHMFQHTGEKPYHCSFCPEKFVTRRGLLIHHDKMHPKSERPLALISKNILLKSYLFNFLTNETKMKIHQTPGKSYSCKDCGRSYNTKSNLKTHSVTHSNERPYQCHFCKKSFKRNQDLKFHVNQHTGNKPFKCPFCDKCFASSGNCYSHRSRMHPGRRIESKLRRRTVPVRDLLSQPRPDAVVKTNCAAVKGVYKYQCQTCNHTFMKRDNFMYHMFQHTGEKPYHCSFCPEKFVTRRGLLIHHDKMHPKSERPLALISKNILLK